MNLSLGSSLPLCEEREHDPVTLVDVIYHLDDHRVIGLIKVDEGGFHGVVVRQNELESDRSLLIVDLEGHLAANLDVIALSFTGAGHADDLHFGGRALPHELIEVLVYVAGMLVARTAREIRCDL